jgi:methionyl-tRNA formyltransferase
MKVIFLGTPDFAVASLNGLIASRHEVLAVVTQPDRMRDRMRVTYSAVKECALKHGLRVLQYENVSREGVEEIRALKPDVMVTAAFGQILSEEFLAVAPKGVVNVHASLLPKYRGSSPIQWAIVCGERETGVTIMKTAYKMDSGDIILQKKTAIGADETAGELFDRLSVIGADALIEALDKIEEGTAEYVPQDESNATYFPMLKKESGRLDFTKTAAEIKHAVLGFNPWPTAFTYLNKKLLKVFKVVPIDVDSDADNGAVISADKNGLVVKCGGGAVRLFEIQAENGKRMSDASYLLGHKIEVGTVLK